MIQAASLFRSLLASGLVYADKLDDIKQVSVPKIMGVNSHSSFGFVDKKTKQLGRVNRDIVNGIKKLLSVTAECQPTNLANRMPLYLFNITYK